MDIGEDVKGIEKRVEPLIKKTIWTLWMSPTQNHPPPPPLGQSPLVQVRDPLRTSFGCLLLCSCGVGHVGHVAKVIFTVAEVRRTRDFGSG